MQSNLLCIDVVDAGGKSIILRRVAPTTILGILDRVCNMATILSDNILQNVR